MGNRIRYGLRNVHYAIWEAGAYGKSYPIAGAVSLSVSPLSEAVHWMDWDGARREEEQMLQGYDGRLEAALFPDHFRRQVLGEQEESGGVIVERVAPIRKSFALLFEISGDRRATRYVLYHCRAVHPGSEAGTRRGRIEPNTESMDIRILPDPYGRIRGRTGENTLPEIYDSWFEQVH